MKEKPKNKKARYGILQNCLFMIGVAWKEGKSVLVIAAVQIALYVSSGMLDLFVVPSVLHTVETASDFSEIVTTILLFSAGMILTGGLISYFATNTMCGRVNIRLMLLKMVHKKIFSTSYPNTENPDFLKQSEAANRCLESNIAPGEAIWETLVNLLNNLICFFLYLTVLTGLDPFLIIVSLAVSVASYGISNHFNGWANRHRDERAAYGRQMHYISQRATDRKLAKDIRIFQLGPWLEELYQHTFRLFQDFCKREQRTYLHRDLISALFVLLRNGIAYVYLITITIRGNLTASQFLLYFTAITGFTTWINGILSQMSVLYRQSLDISVLREFLDYKEPFLFEKGKTIVPKADIPYEIALRDVSFRYPNTDKDVLSHINLTIHPGEKLAVVGLNGAGKTTLIKLICGFYDPTEGTVLLNGQDIRQYNRQDYYRHFSAVFQSFSQLPGTIAENVAQAGSGIDNDSVLRCIGQAGLSDKIRGLSLGIETLLGRDVYEDATELSGGEQQRLMLARALYKNSPIILLDEPTAALDPIAESAIYQKYQELTAGRTSVYISHRLASTRFCDRILLLEHGVIAEEGTHEGLLALGGSYAKLFEIQSKYYKENEESGGNENEESGVFC